MSSNFDEALVQQQQQMQQQMTLTVTEEEQNRQLEEKKELNEQKEDRIEISQTAMASFMESAKKNQVAADEAASGMAVTTHKSKSASKKGLFAKIKGWFRKKSREKKIDKKKANPTGFRDFGNKTMDLHDNIQDLMKRRAIAQMDYKENEGEDCSKLGLDGRVFDTYMQTYNVKKDGTPATAEDHAKKMKNIEDWKILTSYTYDQKKIDMLDGIVNELLGMELSLKMTELSWISSHVEEYRLAIDKLCYFQNLSQSEMNRKYFESLDPSIMEILNAKQDMASDLAGIVSALSANYWGVSVGKDGSYLAYEPGGVMDDEMVQGILDGHTARFKENATKVAGLSNGLKPVKTDASEV